VGHAACKRNYRDTCKVSVTKHEGKRPFLLKTWAGWEANIKMDLKKQDRREWAHLALNRDQWQALVNTVVYLQVPQNVGNFLTE
jgi:hypothetical protein